jgi:hypothetical protein
VLRRQDLFMKVVFCLLLCGCSSSGEPPRHYGPRINIRDFINNPRAYKGKSITLGLKVDEPIDRSKGQTLRDYVGRDAKFVTLGPKGERLSLVITIPQDLPVPDAGAAEDLRVTFVCSRGDLRRGNEAKAIEKP